MDTVYNPRNQLPEVRIVRNYPMCDEDITETSECAASDAEEQWVSPGRLCRGLKSWRLPATGGTEENDGSLAA